MRPRLALVAAALLLAAAGWAEEPEAPAQPDESWWECQWMIPASGIFARGDAGLDSAADEAIRRSEAAWNRGDVRDVMRTARQGTELKAAGQLATQIGRVGAWAGVLGAASSGDLAGMGQEGVNALLGDVAAAAGAAAGAALAVALLPATASVAAVTVAGFVGAVALSTGYDWVVKPVVDSGFDSGVRLSQDRAAARERVERARIWVAEAGTACGDARRWVAQARHGVGEEGTAEETVRWLGEESAAAGERTARARELAAQARESAAPAEAAADAAASASAGQELAADAAGYADEACRIAVEMAGTRQEDARRIWGRADRYVDERARTVASRTGEADGKAREAAARAEEIDALRREAAAAAADAVAELGRLEADVAGGRARLDQLAAEVERARVWLERAAAATEACDGQRRKAVALLDKPPWNVNPEVQSVLQQEVRPLDPPFAEVEALADAISETDAVVASATRRLEEIAAAVARWRGELEGALPPPDAGALERARDAAARAAEARGAAARAAARAGRCAAEARAIAEAAPEETEPPAEGGWERVGGVETVGGAAVAAAPTAPGPIAEVGIEDLLGDAETAYGQCDFAAARAAVAAARARAPGDPYVLEVAARIEAKAERQMAAIAALQSAEQALARGDRKASLAALDRAADAAPDCFTRQVSAVSRGVREGLATQRADADERARAAIGGMLGTLVGVMNAATVAASGGSGTPSGAGAGVYPSGGGGAAGGAPGGAATGGSCWIGGASHAAELYLLLRQRPQPNVTNYVIVPTSRKNAAAAASGTGMELVSQHRSYEDALAAARRACANPVAGSH